MGERAGAFELFCAQFCRRRHCVRRAERSHLRQLPPPAAQWQFSCYSSCVLFPRIAAQSQIYIVGAHVKDIHTQHSAGELYK